MHKGGMIAGLLCTLLLPAVLLWSSLFGGRTFVPYDIAQFAPIATTLEEDELALVRHRENTVPTEVVLTFIPEMRFARQELEAGRLPQWNPVARFGVPLQATAVVGLNYPPNWLVLAHDDPQDGLALGAFVSLAIAAGLMFGFLRALGLGVAAASFGAIAFAASGTLAANAPFYQRLAALIWLPGLLWGVRATTDPTTRLIGVAGLAIAVTMTWLAGFPAYGASCLMVAGIYGVARLLAMRGEGRRTVVTTAAWLGGAVVLGMLVAAVQVLPMTAFFPESSRGAAPTSVDLSLGSLDPGGLFAWFLPSVFGHPHNAAYPSDLNPLAYWLLLRDNWDTGQTFNVSTWNFVEGTIFVGSLTVFLALFAALRPRRPSERALAIAAVVLVVLSQGHAILGWFHAMPFVKSIAPMRFIGPMCGVLAILAAFGLDRIVREHASLRGKVLTVVIPLCAFGALCLWQVTRGIDGQQFLDALTPGIKQQFVDQVPDITDEYVQNYVGGPLVAHFVRDAVVANSLRAGLVLVLCAVWWALASWAAASTRRTRIWIGVAVAGVAVELFAFAEPILHGRELPFSHDTAVHRYLRAERDRLAPDGGYAVVRGTAAQPPARVLPMAMPPGVLVPERIRDVNGYTFLDKYSQEVLREIWGVEHMVKGNAWPYSLPDDKRLGHPYLDLIGVRWILSEDPLTHAGKRVGPALRGSRRRGDGEAVEFFVYERAKALPRAFFVDRCEVGEDDDAIRAALADPLLDPQRAVWFTEAEHAAHGGPKPAADESSRDRDVTFVRDTVHELVLQVGDGPAGWLVLNDSWFSGWEATVDENPVELVRGNLSMRALPVPEGAATVTFRYTPPRFASGLSVSLLSLLGVLALAVIGWIRRLRNST